MIWILIQHSVFFIVLLKIKIGNKNGHFVRSQRELMDAKSETDTNYRNWKDVLTECAEYPYVHNYNKYIPCKLIYRKLEPINAWTLNVQMSLQPISINFAYRYSNHTFEMAEQLVEQRFWSCKFDSFFWLDFLIYREKTFELFHKWNSMEALIISPTVQIKVLQFEKKIDKNLKRPNLEWHFSTITLTRGSE